MTEEQNKNKLPKDWKWVTIPNVVGNDGVFVDGDWIESKDQDPKGDVRLIQLADIGDGNFRNKSSRFLTLQRAKEIKCTFLLEGDILVARMPDPIGRACIFPLKGENKYVTAVDVAIIRPGDEKIDKKYLLYSINNPKFRNDIEDLQSGTTRKRISRKNLSLLEFPLPPKPTQQAIVSKIEELFSELDKGIENLRAAQQQLKTYRQSVLKWAFEGKLTNENIKEGELPKGWKNVSITELAEKNKHALKAGPFGSSLKKEFHVEKGYKIYGQEQVINDDAFYGDYYISEEKYQELSSCKIKPFDILISLVGTVGKVLLLPENCAAGIINPRLIKVSLDRNVYLPKFFKYYFESSFVKSFYGAETRGTTMDVLNLGIIKAIPFPLCTIEEQNKIVQEIESRLSVADKMEESITQSLQHADALRQSILKKAFKGRLIATGIIETVKQPAKVIPFERKVLAGKIIHLLYDDKYFGLTKFQKIFYLVENFAEVSYETNFIQERAGPYDKEFTIAFRKEMQEKNWAQEEQKGSITKFIPGENIGSLISNYATYFRDKGSQITFVIKQLKDKSTHEAELIATIYAVWNNSLIKKKPIKIEMLVEDFFNWSAKKRDEFQEEEVVETFKWMKEVKLIPKGFGKAIETL